MTEPILSTNLKPGNEKGPSRIAYTVPAPFGINLKVLYSANAWWMDQTKFYRLIAAFSIGATIKEACSAAKISLRQYKYFTSLHPEFREARKGYECDLGLRAKFNLAKAIHGGGVDEEVIEISKQYLIKTEPEIYGRPSRRKEQKMTKREKRIEELKARSKNEEDVHSIDPEVEAAREHLQKVIEIQRKKK